MYSNYRNIGVLGAGTWGIALARALSNAGHSIAVWSKIDSEIKNLSRTHRHANLPNIEIPQEITFTNDIRTACADKDIIICAVPSVFVRSTMELASKYISDSQIIVDVAKGVEFETLFTMSEVIRDELNKVDLKKVPVVALSGPTHAEEVARDLPTTIVAACEDNNISESVQEAFKDTCICVYTNPDVKGVEICGAIKNVIALASGIAAGLGYGDNARAAIITRGLAEIQQLGIAMGCQEGTFSGLAGIGDLIVTATSKHSRNNKFGYLIGQGYSPDDAKRQVGMVVEGLNALPVAIKLAEKYQVEMPIVKLVDSIIYDKTSAADAFNTFFGPDKKSELVNPILDFNYKTALLDNLKGEQHMKRVITYGTFDLLHQGHINLLRRAKALGDYLVVAISTDEFNWNEKHKKCYFSYEQRKALVESIRYVDLVIPEENWEQKRKDIKEYHIDTFVMGDDWKGKFDFLKEEGAEVVYLPRTPEISSTQIKMDLNNTDLAGK